MRTDIVAALRRVATSYVLVVVLGLIVGLAIAPVVWGPGAQTDGTIAVVPVEGAIDGGTAAAYSDAMQQARSSSSVEAVVLLSNSGGGSAPASESMYLETKRTAREMPVVASVDSSAASGAYYTVVPSDYIYAKPASIVGSVGVRATLPEENEPNDAFVTTGPNKLTGADQLEYYAVIESMRRAFLNAVFEQRADDLTLSRADVSQAQVYAGSQAVQNGMADAIGDRRAAVRKAAEMAGLDDYRVRVLRNDGATIQFVSRGNYLASAAENKTMVGPEYLVSNRSGAPTFLMVQGSYLAGPVPTNDGGTPGATGGETPARSGNATVQATAARSVDATAQATAARSVDATEVNDAA